MGKIKPVVRNAELSAMLRTPREIRLAGVASQRRTSRAFRSQEGGISRGRAEEAARMTERQGPRLYRWMFEALAGMKGKVLK